MYRGAADPGEIVQRAASVSSSFVLVPAGPGHRISRTRTTTRTTGQFTGRTVMPPASRPQIQPSIL